MRSGELVVRMPPVYWGVPGMTAAEGGSFALPAGTVAFLLTDVEGSTVRWEAEPEAMAASMAQHDRILDVAVAAHGGVRPTAQGEGDSIVAAFSRASDAVLAARDAQLALQAAEWSAIPLRVRMAVHSGEARFAEDGNYAGQAIIRTARLRAIAHGGQVLVSAPARDLTVDQLGDQIDFVDLGEHRLRDLARPERVYQLCGSGLEAEFPPLRSLDAHTHNLPTQLSSFIGRTGEIATVVSLVEANRLVTITGAGGAGKTRLALQVAAELVERWRDGTWWVELAEISDPDEAAAAVAATVGVKGERGEGAADALATVLADRRMIVVLDNCEHLVAGVARLVDRLLRSCAGLQVLATSREPLEVSGEIAWRIPPLAVPEARSGVPTATHALSQYDSVRLFLDRAQRVRPNFHATDDNVAAIAEICTRLDGIPLAIELAAARVRSLPPERILLGLDDAFRVLTGGGRVALPRQQTLEASIAWSHALLRPDEQVLHRRLSVFAGGCTLEDLEAVVSDDQLPAWAVLDLIDRLVAQSLVALDDRGPTARYRMLETVRQFARSKLDAAGESADQRSRHAAHYAQLAVVVGPELEGNEVVPMARLAAEHDNLRAALDTLRERSEWSTIADVCDALTELWLALDPVAGDAWVSLALDHIATDAPAGGRLLLSRAMLQLAGGNVLSGLVDAQQAIASAEAAGDERTLFRSRGYLATMSALFDPTAADVAIAEAVTRLQALGDEFGAALFCCGRSFVCTGVLGDTDRGWQLDADAAAATASLGNGTLMAFRLALSANRHCLRGEYEDALRDIDAAETLLKGIVGAAGTDFELAVRRSVPGAYARFTEAWATVGLGRDLDFDQIDRTIASAQAEGFYLAEALLGFALGVLALFAQLDPDVACERLEAASTRARQLGFQALWVVAEGVRAWAEYHRGDLVRALELLDEVEAAAPDWPIYQLARNPSCRAAVLLAQGDPARAEGLAHEALDVAFRYTFRLEAAECLELLARIDLAHQSPLAAARLFGAAARLRDDFGIRMRHHPAIRPEDLAADAGADADEVERAFAAGYALTLDEVVQYARRMRGARRRPSHGWGSLTPTELAVVEQVTAGLTNPQIAEKLFMSRETVKTHLSHVYTKLGVSTRAALAAEATTRSRGTQ